MKLGSGFGWWLAPAATSDDCAPGKTDRMTLAAFQAWLVQWYRVFPPSHSCPTRNDA